MGMDARRMGLVGLLILAVLACVPASAMAVKQSRKKAIWGPVRVNGVSQFPIYKDLGAGIYMTRVNWWQIAPTRPAHPADPNDPAYHWPADIDDAIQQAKQYGMQITMELSDSPGWASGHPGDPSRRSGRTSSRRRWSTATSR
jgi:hypothetical protein